MPNPITSFFLEIEMPILRGRPQLAFTLIELLVVVLIVLILAGLIVGSAYPTIRFNAMKNETSRRVSNILTGAQMFQVDDGDRIEALIRVTTGRDLRLRTLRQVITEAVRHETGESALAYFPPNFPVDQLPPNLRTRQWAIGPHRIRTRGTQMPSSLLLPGRGLEFHIAFHHRQLPIDEVDGQPQPTFDLWGPVVQSMVNAYTKPLFIPEDSANFRDQRDRRQNFQVRHYTDSPIGESLDATLEVMPAYDWRSNDANPAGCSYRLAWPNLMELRKLVDNRVVYEQQSWQWGPPWHNAGLGALATPILPFPWGESIISRNIDRGDQVAQVQPLHMRDMNPLITPQMLLYTGVLAGHDQDVDRWRQDRDPRQTWNDTWGNPILMAAAAYHAPRYDFVDTGPFAEQVQGHFGGGGGRKLISNELHGGRDFLYRKSMEIYGAARGVYLTAGAVGPGIADSDLPHTWEAEEDPEAIKQLWTYITDRCLPIEHDEAGWNWTEKSFLNPPHPPQDSPWVSMRIFPDFLRNTESRTFSAHRTDPTFLAAPQLLQ
ncbi:MAG: prepilin-type N-terminal cleavage/methylation domain-containing protein [Planctomycetota bacterium]|nr:MAG: prepilin-type N-terminal cleavage/methylation domain-containing protein [Planctomycetota bacterium]